MIKIMTRSAFGVFVLCGAAWSATIPQSAPASGPAEAATSSVAESTARADMLLNDAEVWVSELEKTVKGGKDGSGCPPNFTMRNYLHDKKERRGEKELGTNIPDAGGASWEFGLVCRAIAAKSAAPCAEASDVVRFANGAGNSSKKDSAMANGGRIEYGTQKDKCSVSYQQMRVKIAYAAHDPNFMAICREMSQANPPAKSPAAVDAICTAWQNTTQDKSALISAIMSGMKTPLKPETAREVAAEITADPASCENGNRSQALECNEINDYRNAVAKRGTCRGGLCRMLTGEGAGACDSYDLEVKKFVCSNFYRAKYSAERAPVIEERLRLAETLVASLSSRVTDIREAQAFNDRLDRVYALRDRMTQAVAILGKLGKTVGKAPAKVPGNKR